MYIILYLNYNFGQGVHGYTPCLSLTKWSLQGGVTKLGIYIQYRPIKVGETQSFAHKSS